MTLNAERIDAIIPLAPQSRPSSATIPATDAAGPAFAITFATPSWTLSGSGKDSVSHSATRPWAASLSTSSPRATKSATNGTSEKRTW